MKFRRFVEGVGIVAVLIGATSAGRADPVPASNWNVSYGTDVRIFSWEATRKIPGTLPETRETGTQIMVPLSLQLTGRPNEDWKLDFLTRGGFISSRVTNNGAQGAYDGATDTSVSGTATYSGFGWWQPFGSIAVNLPTGQTVLRGADAAARGDSDTALIPVFGEGLNVGPTIGTNILFNASLVGSIAIGYTDRGKFEREGPTILGVPTNDQLDPGDVTTATGTLSYRGERLSLKGSVAYSWEGVTKLNGQSFYQSGDRVILTGAAGYAFDVNWSAKGQVTFSHFDRNKVRFIGISSLLEEYFNSNSNLTRVVADLTYARDGWSVGPVASYLYRDHNGYDPTAFEFVSAKTAWTAGIGAGVTPTPMTRLTMRVEHFWAADDSSPNKVQFNTVIPNSGNPSVQTRGWLASVGGVIRF